MVIPDARSGQLAARLLELSPSDLSLMLRQLHPDDLRSTWACLSPWQCTLIWERFRRDRSQIYNSNILEKSHGQAV
jgi:hypothetical protein